MKKLLAHTMAMIFLATAMLWAERAKGDEYDKGKKLYNDKCQICHGVKGDGNGPAASALSPKPANFNDPKFWQGDVDKKMTETIEHGHGMMPAFELEPSEIKAIIDYVSHTFKPTR